MMQVRIYLYEMRTKKGWSTWQLARRSGVSQSHIVRIENRDTSPTVSCLCRLADALDVNVHELFSHKKGEPYE